MRVDAGAVAIEVVTTPARRAIERAPGRGGGRRIGHVDVRGQFVLIGQYVQQFGADRVGGGFERGQERKVVARPPWSVGKARHEEEAGLLQRMRWLRRRTTDVPPQRLRNPLQRRITVL